MYQRKIKKYSQNERDEPTAKNVENPDGASREKKIKAVTFSAGTYNAAETEAKIYRGFFIVGVVFICAGVLAVVLGIVFQAFAAYFISVPLFMLGIGFVVGITGVKKNARKSSAAANAEAAAHSVDYRTEYLQRLNETDGVRVAGIYAIPEGRRVVGSKKISLKYDMDAGEALVLADMTVGQKIVFECDNLSEVGRQMYAYRFDKEDTDGFGENLFGLFDLDDRKDSPVTELFDGMPGEYFELRGEFTHILPKGEQENYPHFCFDVEMPVYDPPFDRPPSVETDDDSLDESDRSGEDEEEETDEEQEARYDRESELRDQSRKRLFGTLTDEARDILDGLYEIPEGTKVVGKRKIIAKLTLNHIDIKYFPDIQSGQKLCVEHFQTEKDNGSLDVSVDRGEEDGCGEWIASFYDYEWPEQIERDLKGDYFSLSGTFTQLEKFSGGGFFRFEFDVPVFEKIEPSV